MLYVSPQYLHKKIPTESMSLQKTQQNTTEGSEGEKEKQNTYKTYRKQLTKWQQ